MSRAEMPTIADAKRMMNCGGLIGIAIITFDGHAYKIVSYGDTKRRCAAIGKMVDKIARDIDDGRFDLSDMERRP